MWTHLKDSKRKARKPHICELCALPILPGEMYIIRSGVDGRIISFKMHIECEEVTRNWREDDWVADDPVMFRKELSLYRDEQRSALSTRE